MAVAIRLRCANGDWLLPHSVTLPLCIHLGGRHVRLDRHVLDMRDVVGAFYNCRTIFPGCGCIAFADFEVVGNIGARLGEDEIHHLVLAQVRVQQWGCRRGAEFRIEHTRQRLIFHLDQRRPPARRSLRSPPPPRPPGRRHSAPGRGRRCAGLADTARYSRGNPRR